MRLRLLELVLLVIMPWSFVSAQNRPTTLPGNLFLPYKQNQKTAVFGKPLRALMETNVSVASSRRANSSFFGRAMPLLNGPIWPRV